MKICNLQSIQIACEYKMMPLPCCKFNGYCGDFGCVDWQPDLFAWEKLGIGRMLIFLALEGLLFYIIIALIELKVFQSIQYSIQKMSNKIIRALNCKSNKLGQKNKEELEDDVKRESLRIQNTPFDKLVDDNILIFKELTKRYNRKSREDKETPDMLIVQQEIPP